MRFTWHEPKRQNTLRRRGLDFADSSHIFAGPTITFEDARMDYGEQRWVSMGLLREKVIVMVHTESIDEIRIISMREATKHEQILFFSEIW